MSAAAEVRRNSYNTTALTAEVKKGKLRKTRDQRIHLRTSWKSQLLQLLIQ
jgi:hypothetical protein